MTSLTRVVKFLKKTMIAAVIISALVSLSVNAATYYMVSRPEIESAQRQNVILEQQNVYLRQQIFIMNETLKSQKAQNQILQESLQRKPDIRINVYPAYQWEVVYENGIIGLQKRILPIAWNQPTVFHIYVSNVGTGVAQVFYLAVAYVIRISNETWFGNDAVQDLGGKILKPYDTMNLTYTFDSGRFFHEHGVIGTPLQFTFAVMSTETTSYFTLTIRLE